MRIQELTDFDKYVTNLIGSRSIPQSDFRVIPDFFPLGKILQMQMGELNIRHSDEGMVESSNFCGTQADILDGAYFVPKSTEIAHNYRLRAEQRNRRNQVFNGLLQSQSDSQPTDTEPCKNGGHTKPEIVEPK